jgi:nucleotide-binding universal stress UspA family protein
MVVVAAGGGDDPWGVERRKAKVPVDRIGHEVRPAERGDAEGGVRIGADLLIMGLAYRRRFGGDFAIGRTIPYVLKNAPCAVWVVREPMPEEGA